MMLAVLKICLILFTLQGGVDAQHTLGKRISANGQYQCTEVSTIPADFSCMVFNATATGLKTFKQVPIGNGGIYGRFQDGGDLHRVLPADFDPTGHMVMDHKLCAGQTIQACLVVYPELFKDDVQLFVLGIPPR